MLKNDWSKLEIKALPPQIILHSIGNIVHSIYALLYKSTPTLKQISSKQFPKFRL
jgi:hypothetical protein